MIYCIAAVTGKHTELKIYADFISFHADFIHFCQIYRLRPIYLTEFHFKENLLSDDYFEHWWHTKNSRLSLCKKAHVMLTQNSVSTFLLFSRRTTLLSLSYLGLLIVSNEYMCQS